MRLLPIFWPPPSPPEIFSKKFSEAPGSSFVMMAVGVGADGAPAPTRYIDLDRSLREQGICAARSDRGRQGEGQGQEVGGSGGQVGHIPFN